MFPRDLCDFCWSDQNILCKTKMIIADWIFLSLALLFAIKSPKPRCHKSDKTLDCKYKWCLRSRPKNAMEKSLYSNISGKTANSKNVINGASRILIIHFCHIKSSKNILHTKLISIPLCRRYPAKIGPGYILVVSCCCGAGRGQWAYYLDCQKVTGWKTKRSIFEIWYLPKMSLILNVTNALICLKGIK